MNPLLWLERLAPSLKRLGLDQFELFLKEGRSRRFEIGPQGVISGQSSEVGWAVRATGPRTSLFAAGTDAPPTAGPWPQPDGYPIQLPPLLPGEEWQEPPDIESPLLVESEALDLLEACARGLETELPGARLLRAVLEDGASSSRLASSLGIDASTRSRTATLFLEAAAPDDSGERVTELIGKREGRRLSPPAIARRLTDRLVIRSRGTSVERDRAPCLLAPPVSARILAGLLPLLVGPKAEERALPLTDRQGRLASERLSVLDDPRRPEGLFCAAHDGEGVPTRSLTLVDRGSFRQPLVGWWQLESASVRPAGCSRRPGWREPPRIGPSHLFIRPDPSSSVPQLLGTLARGYYFLEVYPGGEFDLEGDRFRLPVAGFEVADGRARQPVAHTVIQGRISALLHGVQGVGRDLDFFPMGGALGAPTLLVTGLEIAAA